MARRKKEEKYSDKELLELFVERVEKLKRNSLISEGKLKRVKFRMAYEDGKGTWFELLDVNDEPINTESLDSLLATFRHMYMQSGNTNFRKIAGIARQHSSSEHVPAIDAFNGNWSKALREETSLLSDDDQPEKVSTILENYLNGELFHDDKSKRDFVLKWGDVLVGEVLFVVNFLRFHIIGFGDFIAEGLANGWFDFPSDD